MATSSPASPFHTRFLVTTQRIDFLKFSSLSSFSIPCRRTCRPSPSRPPSMPRPHQSTTGTDTGGGGGDSHRTRSSATSTDVDICLDDGPRVPRLSPGIQEASASSMTTTKIITSATSAMAESTTRRKGATGANIRNGGTKRRNQKNRLSSSPLQKKKEEILQVLSEDKIDLWRLRELALTEYGFVNGALIYLLRV